ncbi:MAG: 2OG-Fe(II) oxygenase [Acidobacteria bacterium]|nr:2OG-Fe(II) oxygenase [Acidobacteriota bacterium]
MAETKIDVLRLDGFLDGAQCELIVTEMRAASTVAASVSGGAKAVDPYVRNVLCAEVSQELVDLVADRLVAIAPQLASHFGVHLNEIEDPQFLHYRVGDHFVAHQDGNTPLIHDDTLARKVSVVVFLNPQSDVDNEGSYAGGSLVLHGTYPDWGYRQDITSPPGTLVAFRSETTHEVQPVTAGERFTIVSWFRE